MIFIGADGGGTGTTLAAYENGVRIASAEAGPLNYRFIPPEEAVRHFTEGMAALGLDPEKIAAVGIADPSLDDEAEAGDEAAARFYGLLREKLSCPVFSRSDAYITLFGLTGGEGAGVLMIAGTGAMGIAVNEKGVIRTAGGWGRLTGDEGSGYYIAAEGIRAALRAADGITPATCLTQALLKRFGASSPRGLIPVLYGDPEPDIASFARDVADCAEGGDGEAQRILSDAAGWLARYAEVLVRWSGCRRVGIWGSVLLRSAAVREAFERDLRERIGEAEFVVPPIPAEEAAARYAQRCLKMNIK